MVLKKYSASLMITIMIFISLYSKQEQKAIIVVPVADLLSTSLFAINKNHTTKLDNSTLPISGKNENKACPRLHQLIFNEQVNVIEELGSEVKIYVSNHYCQTDQSDNKQSTYWTAKKNIIMLDQLKKMGVELTIIPAPISHHAPFVHDSRIVTLKQPFNDDQSGLIFSVGTRFVKTSQQRTKLNTQVVYYNPRTHEQQKLIIPNKYLITQHKNPEAQIREYVQLIRTWANGENGIIPYVWGGCSFSSRCKDKSFSENMNADNHPYYFRHDDMHGPHNGLDCSGLILRGTQLCGIPYFYKNSTTLAKNLMTLTNKDSIENGDIIWFPGHVIVISDVNKNLVVEARGYEHGYGKVHETSLDEQFRNIRTYEQLKQAYLTKTPLERLDKQGNIVKTLTNYKILKLKSVWSQAKNGRHTR